MCLATFLKAVTFRIALVMRVGRGAAYGDAALVAMVGVVVKAAMGYVALNVLIGHGRSSLDGL